MYYRTRIEATAKVLRGNSEAKVWDMYARIWILGHNIPYKNTQVTGDNSKKAEVNASAFSYVLFPFLYHYASFLFMGDALPA